MSFVTRAYLDRFTMNLSTSKIQELKSRPTTLNESYKYSYQKIIFLSHSHRDKDIVEKVALFLLNQGTYVYVDWQDSSMPPVTSAETANKIKNRIRFCDEFVVLASNNALESKWVPWELGYADSAKGVEKVSIFPVADNDGSWRGSEYFDLYQKIELGRLQYGTSTVLNEAIIRKPQHSYTGNSLKQKLNQNSDNSSYVNY